MLNNHEAGIQYYFTDWSDTTTFGKTTDQNLEIPDEMPAPDISNPKRELNEDGIWDYVSVMTHFSHEVTDALNAIYLKTGEREPFVIITEAAVDDLTDGCLTVSEEFHFTTTDHSQISQGYLSVQRFNVIH